MFSEEGYRALTAAAGVVRRSDRGVLRVGGADRLSWLQGLLTNDVQSLPIGGICDAAYLTPQGRMITDLRVINLSDCALLDVPAAVTESLHARLERLLFSEDAHVRNVSAEIELIEIHGPRAVEVTRDLDVTRHDAFGVPGFLAFVPIAEVMPFLAAVVTRGAIEASLDTLDVVRIESGRPAFHVDMDEHTIPLEAGLENRAISFTKGCYVGQEVIVRVMHRGGGRVARKLVGLRWPERTTPPAGTAIASNGRQVGHLTSIAWSPRLLTTVALGYVHRDFTAPGTALLIQAENGAISAEVAALPFVAGPLH